jgi:hypothetical protein
MICWGSWGNTQKLVSKNWRYELFYWDYVIGMVLFTILLGFTMGSHGDTGRSFLEDLGQASGDSIGWVILGGVIFNASNILLSASISLAGMSVAFPLGVGMALVGGCLSGALRGGSDGCHPCLGSAWSHFSSCRGIADVHHQSVCFCRPRCDAEAWRQP